MRIMAAFAVTLLPLAAAAAAPHHSGTGRAAPPHGNIRVGEAPANDPMNFFRQGPGCVPIQRQVMGENRHYSGTRLDQEPPGRMILAVDRQVNGCHEVALLSAEPRRR
jgi:hypothetical protein